MQAASIFWGHIRYILDFIHTMLERHCSTLLRQITGRQPLIQFFCYQPHQKYVSVACINNLKKGAIPCPRHLHSFVFFKNAISLGPVSPILYFTGQVWTRDVLGCWVALLEL